MKLVSLLISLLVAFVAVGCSGSTATLTSPSPVDLIAPQLPGTWNLVSIRPAGEAEQAKPSGASYTLTLVDGRLSTRADCNTCGGTYTLNGQTLMASSSMACTRAACPTMAFENAYMKLLGGESTVALSGGTIELTSPRGVLRFTR